MLSQRYFKKLSCHPDDVLLRQRYALHVFKSCAVHRHKDIGNRLGLAVLVCLRRVFQPCVHHVIRVVHSHYLALHRSRDPIEHDIAVTAFPESNGPGRHGLQIQRLRALYFHFVALLAHWVAELIVTCEYFLLQPVHLNNVSYRLLNVLERLFRTLDWPESCPVILNRSGVGRPPLGSHLEECRAQQLRAELGLLRPIEEGWDDLPVLLHVVEQCRSLPLVQLHRSGASRAEKLWSYPGLNWDH